MIRQAQPGDAHAIAAIYNHYIAGSAATFEETAVTEADIARRLDSVASAGLPWLVLEAAAGTAAAPNGIVGYAYASRWRERSAYRFSVETSIYLKHTETGRGHARLLYGTLLDTLRDMGAHAAIGGIALPNAASVGLHEALGFEKVAHFREVGYKFERWIDVGYWQRILA